MDEALTLKEQEKPGTLEYCIYFLRYGNLISPWDDIPYKQKQQPPQPPNYLYHYVVEIPRGTNAKLEIDYQDSPYHPIRQDTIGKRTETGERPLRFVPDILGQKGYPVNYGSIPQTWSSRDIAFVTDTGEELFGDGAPIDLCDISSPSVTVGEVRTVKILGSLCLIDQGECDLKVIGIDTLDPDFSQFDGIMASEDGNLMETKINELKSPGFVQLIREWFRDYDTVMPGGLPPNRYGFGGKLIGVQSTCSMIEEAHTAWKLKPKNCRRIVELGK